MRPKRTPHSTVNQFERIKIRMSKNPRKRSNLMRVSWILLREISRTRRLKRKKQNKLPQKREKHKAKL